MDDGGVLRVMSPPSRASRHSCPGFFNDVEGAAPRLRAPSGQDEDPRSLSAEDIRLPGRGGRRMNAMNEEPALQICGLALGADDVDDLVKTNLPNSPMKSPSARKGQRTRRSPPPLMDLQEAPTRSISASGIERRGVFFEDDDMYRSKSSGHILRNSKDFETSLDRRLATKVKEIHKMLRVVLPELEAHVKSSAGSASASSAPAKASHITMCCQSAVPQIRSTIKAIEEAVVWMPGSAVSSKSVAVASKSSADELSREASSKSQLKSGDLHSSRPSLTYDFVFTGHENDFMQTNSPTAGSKQTDLGDSGSPRRGSHRPKGNMVKQLSLCENLNPDQKPDIGSKRKDFEKMENRYQLSTGENVDSANLCFIHPERPFRMGWDFGAFFLIMILSFLVPLELAFFWDAEQPDAMIGFGYVVDIFFCIDIFLNFFTASHQGHGIAAIMRTDLKFIAKNYAKGWLLIDIPASIPFLFEVFGAIFLPNRRDSSEETDSMLLFRMFRYAKVARVAKMLRIIKLGGLMQAIEEKLVAAQSMTVAFQLLKMTVVMLLFAHWLACVWFFIGYQHEKAYPGIPTWLSAADIVDAKPAHQYIAAFYFAITTGTTIGYGEISPTNSWERSITAFMLLASVAYIGQFLGRVSHMVNSMRERETMMAAAKRESRLFMMQRNVNKDLQFKVLRYIEHTYETEAITHMDKEIMDHLSNSLQNELALSITGNVFKHFPLFDSFDSEFLTALCKVGRTQRAGMGDTVAAEEQAAHEMFWIVKGEVAVKRRGRFIYLLKEGDWFGELALFFPGAIRTATIKCELLSEFLVLHHDDFQLQLNEFPHLKVDFDNLKKELKAGDPRGLKLHCKRCGANTHLTRDCPMRDDEDHHGIFPDFTAATEALGNATEAIGNATEAFSNAVGLSKRTETPTNQSSWVGGAPVHYKLGETPLRSASCAESTDRFKMRDDDTVEI